MPNTEEQPVQDKMTLSLDGPIIKIAKIGEPGPVLFINRSETRRQVDQDSNIKAVTDAIIREIRMAIPRVKTITIDVSNLAKHNPEQLRGLINELVIIAINNAPKDSQNTDYKAESGISD